MAENEFNKLERAVLDSFKEHYQNEELSAQIDAAKLVERDWTKVGFDVSMQVPHNLEVVELKELSGSQSDGKWPIDGPHIESPQIDIGALCILWGKNGYIDCIEMVAYGENFAEHVEEFKLHFSKNPGPGLFPWIAMCFRRLFGKKE